MTRAAIGSISGSSIPRDDRKPTWRGAMTLEQDLKAGSKIWLSGWSRQVSGADFISLSAEVAVGGGPRRKATITERTS
jgi:hypothetical protein